MFRVEVNPANIGVEMETPFSLNPTRVAIANNPRAWNLLEMLVNVSLAHNISLVEACDAAVARDHSIGTYLPNIWEVMFEMARPKEVPQRRTDCAFFFKEKEDALRFKATYPGMQGGTLCEVTILEQRFIKECDMKWLDDINENVATAGEILEEFTHYWNSELTAHPVREILFCGRYMLKPVV